MGGKIAAEVVQAPEFRADLTDGQREGLRLPVSCQDLVQERHG